MEYEDAEGDLGEESPEVRTLSIKDSRLPEADYYHVQPLAPIGSTVWIRGTLAVHIPRLFLMSVAESEEAVFTARIQDKFMRKSPKLELLHSTPLSIEVPLIISSFLLDDTDD